MVLLGKPADFLGTVWGLDSWAGKCETGRREEGRGRDQRMRCEERRRKKGGERMQRCLREEKGVRGRGRGYTTLGPPQGGKRTETSVHVDRLLEGFRSTWRGFNGLIPLLSRRRIQGCQIAQVSCPPAAGPASGLQARSGAGPSVRAGKGEAGTQGELFWALGPSSGCGPS